MFSAIGPFTDFRASVNPKAATATTQRTIIIHFIPLFFFDFFSFFDFLLKSAWWV